MVEPVDKLAVGFFVTFASSLILFDIDMTNWLLTNFKNLHVITNAADVYQFTDAVGSITVLWPKIVSCKTITSDYSLVVLVVYEELLYCEMLD